MFLTVIFAQQDYVYANPPDLTLDSKRAKRLTSRLCRLFSKAEHEELDFATEIELLLLKYSKVSETDKDYKAKLATFWNQNSYQFNCRPTHPWPAQHFFSRSVVEGYHSEVLSDYFFADPENFSIDPNIVTVNQYNRYQTVLDYIDKFSENEKDSKDSYYDFESLEKTTKIIETKYNGMREFEFDHSDQFKIVRAPLTNPENLPAHNETFTKCPANLSANLKSQISEVKEYLSYTYDWVPSENGYDLDKTIAVSYTHLTLPTILLV